MPKKEEYTQVLKSCENYDLIINETTVSVYNFFVLRANGNAVINYENLKDYVDLATNLMHNSLSSDCKVPCTLIESEEFNGFSLCIEHPIRTLFNHNNIDKFSSKIYYRIIGKFDFDKLFDCFVTHINGFEQLVNVFISWDFCTSLGIKGSIINSAEIKYYKESWQKVLDLAVGSIAGFRTSNADVFYKMLEVIKARDIKSYDPGNELARRLLMRI